MKRKPMSLSTRSAWTAQAFIAPFYLGFVFFFISPLFQSLRMSFSDVSVDTSGYLMEWAGLEHYMYAFNEDPYFVGYITKSFSNLAWKLPVIIIISLFMAMIINQKFKGRTVIRAIFFLPVIFASGVVLSVASSDVIASGATSGSSVVGGNIVGGNALVTLLTESGFASSIVSLASKISSELFSMIWRAGIPMTIFLAGLQGIPPALYEASSIEGATAWENFWKITLPMLSPIILLNIVYIIVDNFTDTSNEIMVVITNLMAAQISKLGLSAAYAWTYFVLIALVLGAVFLVFSMINKRTSGAK